MTELLAGLFLLALFVIFALYTAYRRQIKDICRQLKYLEDNDTNKLVTTDINCREVAELAEHINSLNRSARGRVAEYRKKDERLKEAVAGLSHDIRTPLTSLDGYFQLLSKSEEASEREQYMEVIRGRITALSVLLEELFTYTKLQNDSYRIETEALDFNRAVCGTALSFYGEMKRKGVEPQVDFMEGQAWIYGSQAAISRIVANIIKNALCHGDKQIRLSTFTHEGSAVFACSNTVRETAGLDADRVFERFYKADAARSGADGQEASTGLGLAIARELAEKMGGRAEAALDGEVFTVRVSFSIRQCEHIHPCSKEEKGTA